PRQRDRAHAPLDGVGVDLDPPIIDEAYQPIPVVEGVTDCCGCRAARWQLRHLRLEPRPQVRPQWLAAHPALRLSFCGIPPPYVGLDPIQRSDASERLAGDRRIAALGEIVEAAPDVAPAEREHGSRSGGGWGQLLVG